MTMVDDSFFANVMGIVRENARTTLLAHFDEQAFRRKLDRNLAAAKVGGWVLNPIEVLQDTLALALRPALRAVSGCDEATAAQAAEAGATRCFPTRLMLGMLKDMGPDPVKQASDEVQQARIMNSIDPTACFARRKELQATGLSAHEAALQTVEETLRPHLEAYGRQQDLEGEALTKAVDVWIAENTKDLKPPAELLD